MSPRVTTMVYVPKAGRDAQLQRGSSASGLSLTINDFPNIPLNELNRVVKAYKQIQRLGPGTFHGKDLHELKERQLFDCCLALSSEAIDLTGDTKMFLAYHEVGMAWKEFSTAAPDEWLQAHEWKRHKDVRKEFMRGSCGKWAVGDDDENGKEDNEEDNEE
ncbi:hypothetical protein FRC07_007642 [Ceratobasidium sp. 392]|nr:hypothetical protein FRC07_007642 [Ceratobasidium sp. 392]